MMMMMMGGYRGIRTTPALLMSCPLFANGILSTNTHSLINDAERFITSRVCHGDDGGTSVQYGINKRTEAIKQFAETTAARALAPRRL
uniref:Putative secreted protein n=1 Tax=Anopheles darlingi TaxID=43151 RepID=A0A2M4D4L1_ANODA